MIGERRDGGMSLSTPSLRSLLGYLATRLDESRDLSRYLIGLLIFLGWRYFGPTDRRRGRPGDRQSID